MMICSENQSYLFKIISTELSEALKVPPDLSFICENNTMVHTHRILLATFSPFLRSLFASIEPVRSSSSQVVSLPDISSALFEDVLLMITKAWGQQTISLSSKHVGLLRALGIPALSSTVKDVQSLAESLSPSPHFEGESGPKDLGFTPKDHINDLSLDDEKDLSKHDGDQSVEPRCIHCDTVFRDRTQESLEDILVHLGEVHFEVDLDTEHRRLFPHSSNICEECSCVINGDYVQKEHILLTHPWPVLKSTAEEILSIAELPTKETIDQARSLEEPICPEKYESAQPTKTDDESSKYPISQKIDEFIESLSYKREKPVTEHLEHQNQTQVVVPANEQRPSNYLHPDKNIASCHKCTYKWTYHSGTRMSDLKSRIKTHVVDLHLQEELTNVIQISFVGDVCQPCGETLQSLNLKKKHVRKNHGALESDVLSMVEEILGDDFHKKDPLKNKRKGSPKLDSSRRRRTTNLNLKVDSDPISSQEFLQNSNFSETDNLENSSNFREIYKSNLDSDASKACNEIQQAIEFSDSEDD